MRLICSDCRTELVLAPECPTLHVWVWCDRCRVFAKYPSKWQIFEWQIQAIFNEMREIRSTLKAVRVDMRGLLAQFELSGIDEGRP